MTIEHKNIPDSDRHEPKGISLATPDQLYFSSGSSGGAWDVIEAGRIKAPSITDGYILSANEATGTAEWSLNTLAGGAGSYICSDDAGIGGVTLDIPTAVAGSSVTSIPFTATGTDIGVVEGFRFDNTRKQIRVTKAGSYNITYGATILLAANGTNPWSPSETLTIRVYKNGILVPGLCFRIITPGTFTGTNSVCETGAVTQTIQNVSVNDVFDVRLWSGAASARRVLVYHGRLNVTAWR